MKDCKRKTPACLRLPDLNALQIVGCMVLSIFSSIVAVPAFFVWAIGAAAMRDHYADNKYVSTQSNHVLTYVETVVQESWGNVYDYALFKQTVTC